jgi:hypothetical protein
MAEQQHPDVERAGTPILERRSHSLPPVGSLSYDFGVWFDLEDFAQANADEARPCTRRWCGLMMALLRGVPIMAEPAADVGSADVSPLRSWIVRHPIATFLVLVYATTTALVFVP